MKWKYILVFWLITAAISCNNKKDEQERKHEMEMRKLITDEKTDLLDSLIYDYEQSDSGTAIVDSIAHEYNIKEQQKEKEDREDNYFNKEF